MEKHEQVIHFINRIVSDDRLTPVHIALSISLCQRWTVNQFQRVYRISRREIMQASRIRSKATYHKAIKELQTFGYLRYSPSYHPVKASEIELIDNSMRTNNFSYPSNRKCQLCSNYSNVVLGDTTVGTIPPFQ